MLSIHVMVSCMVWIMMCGGEVNGIKSKGVGVADGSESVLEVLWSQVFRHILHSKRDVEFISSLQLHSIYAETALRVLHSQSYTLYMNAFTKRKFKSNPWMRRSKFQFVIFEKELCDIWNHISSIYNEIGNYKNGQDIYLILLLTEPSDEEIKTFLLYTWKKYKLFNCLVVCGNMNLEKHDTFVTVKFYNPYQTYITNDSINYEAFSFNMESVAQWSNMVNRFQRRWKNLDKYPQRITMYKYHGINLPFVNDGKSVQFNYLENKIVEAYASFLNFTPELSFPKDNIHYGSYSSNGTPSSGIKDIEEGYTDLLGYLTSKNYTYKTSYFLKSVKQVKIIIMLSVSKSVIPEIGLSMWILDKNTRWCAFTMMMLIFGMWMKGKYDSIDRRCQLRKCSRLYKAFMETFMNTISAFNNVAYTKNVNYLERMMYMWFVVWVMVLNSVYQAKILNELACRHTKINTLEELDKANVQIFSRYEYAGSLMQGMQGSDEREIEIRQRLTAKLKIVYDILELRRDVKVKNLSVMTFEEVAIAYCATNVDEHGREKYYILKEPVAQQFVAQIAPRWSPLIPTLNKALQYLIQGGIIEHWTSEDNFNINLYRMRRNKRYDDPMFSHQSISLANMRKAFIVWASYLGLSTTVFFIELIVYRFKNLI